MSNKYTSVYDWLKYIKANVVGINLRELRVIESTKCDEMAKDMLVEGDSIEKAIEYYGTNYKQYDLGWGYFIAEYEEEDYDFQIGFYIDDGCVRFSKFLKGFRI